MTISKDVLRYDEQAIMNLRTLYRQFGYSQYRTSRFEEYGLYSENKAFLASGDIVAFTGVGGKLMALRPDVTLSIVKNVKESGELKKLCYNENVYRSDGQEFKEQMQIGLECIGDIDIYSMGEVIMLARRSLEILCEDSGMDTKSCIDLSHMGFITGILQSAKLIPEQSAEILRLISEKNVPGLNSLCADYGLANEFRERVAALASLYGPYSETIVKLRQINANDETNDALREIEAIYGVLRELRAQQDINIDFSIVNDLSYYSGMIFQGYIEGVPSKILSGGRYDKLLRKFGKRSGAVGFAVYLDLLERLGPPRGGMEIDVLLIYGDKTGPIELARAVNSLTASGQSVRTQRGTGAATLDNAGDISYKRLIRM